MTITVRQEHIDAARACGEFRCWKCPVWQAAEEAGITGIRNVSPNFIHYDGEREFHLRKSINLPRTVARWILRFDAGKSVEPFSFEVDNA